MSSNMFVSGFSPPYMLRVSTKTWMRDSHDLFDYETNQQVNVSHFAASCGLKLLRDDAHVSAIEYNNVVDKEHDHLLSVICKRTGEYVVMPAEKISGSLLYPQKLWLIVRTLPYHRYALQENDVIKLGRFRLRVKQLVAAPSETPNSSSATNSVSDKKPEEQIVKLFDGIIPEKTITYEEQCNMQCRICLAEGYLHNPLSSGDNMNNTPLHSSKETSLDTTSDKDLSTQFLPNDTLLGNNTIMSDNSELGNAASFDSDRLICACECKGSIKYVHVDCLRKWIDSRWNLKSDEPLPSMVFIREVSCELCKTNYPCYIKQNGELIQIVKMPKMSVPFLVLENITPHAIKGVHLLSMKDMKDLKLGRGHESDVRIPDVSISRYHATIRYESGQFYLEDHDSKFGTLVAMRKPKMVSQNEPLSVQVGRSVINLSIDESLPYFQNRVMTLSAPNATYNPNANTPSFGPANANTQPNVYRNLDAASTVGLTSSNAHNSFNSCIAVAPTAEVSTNFMGLNTRVSSTAFPNAASNFINPSAAFNSGNNMASSGNNFMGGSNNFGNTATANLHLGGSTNFGNAGPNYNSSTPTFGSSNPPSAFVSASGNFGTGSLAYNANGSNTAFSASNNFKSGSSNAFGPSGYVGLDGNHTHGSMGASRPTIEFSDNPLNSSRYLSFLQSAYSSVMSNSPTNVMSNSPGSAMNTSPSNAMNLTGGSPSNMMNSGNSPSGLLAGPNPGAIMASSNSPTAMMSRNNLAATNASVGSSAMSMGVMAPELSGNLIATNTGSNNIVTTISGSPRTPTNAVPVIGSSNASGNGITDLYWNYMRNAARSRVDSEVLDGLSSQRLNAFRIHQLPSNTRTSSLPQNNSSATVSSNSGPINPPNTASVGAAHSLATGDEPEMLLPESVFIANWNSVPSRNVDVSVDTSTSALENRHQSQELDKPIPRL